MDFGIPEAKSLALKLDSSQNPLLTQPLNTPILRRLR